MKDDESASSSQPGQPRGEGRGRPSIAGTCPTGASETGCVGVPRAVMSPMEAGTFEIRRRLLPPSGRSGDDLVTYWGQREYIVGLGSALA